MPSYTNERTSAARTDVLAAYPNRTSGGLVVRWGSAEESDLARGFAAAAKRLAGTITGAAADDELLMPLLALYRQAFELELKDTIKYAARVRCRAGHSDETYPLPEAPVAKRIRREHGHHLDKLLTELAHHLDRIGVGPVSPETVTVINRFHEADETGTGFRYDGLLPDERDDVEFPDLAGEVAHAFLLTQVISDVIYDQFEQAIEEVE